MAVYINESSAGLPAAFVSMLRSVYFDVFSEPSRTSSDCSRVDHRADGQDFQQQITGLVQAEFDEHVLHYKRIIAAKTRKIKILKRQLASVKKQLG